MPTVVPKKMGVPVRSGFSRCHPLSSISIPFGVTPRQDPLEYHRWQVQPSKPVLIFRPFGIGQPGGLESRLQLPEVFSDLGGARHVVLLFL